MGLLIWKITKNILFYTLVIVVVGGAAYTGVINSVYSVFLGTYGMVSGFLGVLMTNMIFGVVGILIIFSVIGIFYQRD